MIKTKIEDQINNAIKNKTYSIKNERERAFCTDNHHRRMFFEAALTDGVLSEYVLYFFAVFIRCENNILKKHTAVKQILCHSFYIDANYHGLASANIPGKDREKIDNLYREYLRKNTHKDSRGRVRTHGKMETLNEILDTIITRCRFNLFRCNLGSLLAIMYDSPESYSVKKILKNRLHAAWRDKECLKKIKTLDPFKEGGSKYHNIAYAYCYTHSIEDHLPIYQILYITRNGAIFDRLVDDYIKIRNKQLLIGEQKTTNRN